MPMARTLTARAWSLPCRAVCCRALACLVFGLVALGSGSTRASPPSPAVSLARCQQDVDAAPAERESWGCFYNHARASGDWEASAAALRESLTAHEPIQADPRAHGYALAALANIVAELDNDAGLALYERAAEQLRAGDDPLALTMVLLNLAYRHRVAGAPERSAVVLEQAALAARAHGEDHWIATVEVERVRHMLRTSADLGEAARILAEAEPLLFPAGAYQAKVNWLSAALSVERYLGRYRRARAHADRLIALAQAEQDNYVASVARYNRVLVLLDEAQASGLRRPSDELLVEIEAAIVLSGGGVNRWAEATLHCLRGQVLLDRGQTSAAEQATRRCLGEARTLADPRQIVDSALALVSLFLDDGLAFDADRQSEAEGLLDEARALADQSGDHFSRYAVAKLEAALRWRVGPLAQARAASEATLVVVDQLRAEQSDPTSRAEVHATLADAFERYIDNLLRAAVDPALDPGGGANEDTAAALMRAAFDVGERYRAQTLLESLAASGASSAPTPARDAALSRVQTLLRDGTLSADARADALRELDGLEQQPQPSPQPGARPLTELAELQRQLAANEAMFIYQLANPLQFGEAGAPRSWLLVITRASIRAVPLGEVEDLIPRLEMLGPALQRREPPGAQAGVDAGLATLWQLLVAEGLDALPAQVDSLILVLDAGLHQVPFAALRPLADAPATSALGLRYTLSATPSASVLSVQRSIAPPRAASRQRVLALADPPVEGAALQMFPQAPALASLPLARREAALAGHRPGDVVWLGAAASEAALAEAELGAFAVVHFATHAIVDQSHPQRSALILARDRDRDRGDGLLQPREISALRLDGALVVLSACSSSRGQELAGEGVLGLGHALLEAGARAVVGSLWPLRDDDALALFERIYVHLDRGRSIAEALTAAQRDRVEAGATPAAWAGVVILGDGALVPFPDGRPHAATDAAAPPTATGSPLSGWRLMVAVLGVLAVLGIVIIGAISVTGAIKAAATTRE